jgi:hypothetical protein
VRNAKIEFLAHILNTTSKVKAAVVSKYWDYTSIDTEKAVLKIKYSSEDFENFLNKIDFEYDNGFGCQELFGTIWYEDGTWSSRGEYDGSEWWEYNFVPEIPDQLKGE